jgi:hypothetical protein
VVRKSRPTEFYEVAPNVSESSVWDLLNATVLAPRILRWILDYWKSYTLDLTLIALTTVVKICEERDLRRLHLERDD